MARCARNIRQATLHSRRSHRGLLPPVESSCAQLSTGYQRVHLSNAPVAVQVAMARSNNIPYVDQDVEQQLNEWIEGLARNDAVSRVGV